LSKKRLKMLRELAPAASLIRVLVKLPPRSCAAGAHNWFARPVLLRADPVIEQVGKTRSPARGGASWTCGAW